MKELLASKLTAEVSSFLSFTLRLEKNLICLTKLFYPGGGEVASAEAFIECIEAPDPLRIGDCSFGWERRESSLF